jgi:AraC-like DNA-binding protein
MPLKWDEYIGTQLFSNEDGFYKLPYLSNCPQLMVESFAALPVARHDVQEQILSTDNPYFKGEQYYIEIEDGLWLFATDFTFRKNIVSKARYNQQLPSDYYFLSFAVFEYKFPTNEKLTEFATLLSTTCTFYKPDTEVATFFYENTNGKVFNIAFTRNWALKNLTFETSTDAAIVDRFLNNETGFINWLDIVPQAHKLGNDIWQYLKRPVGEDCELGCLGTTLKKIIFDFFNTALAERRITGYLQLNNPDYANVAAAEKLILTHLTNPFLGVDKISRTVNVSPTKLKVIFKSVFGFSMLQYQKERNLLLAMQLLEKSSMRIGNIALTTGYESASKFTASFKKRFGVLPSVMRRK